MTLGFIRAGWQPIAAFDDWSPAVETYRANFGDHITEASISDSTDLPDADVVIGGPPCQGFSSAGTRRAQDERNTLVGIFAKLVARNRPKAFVFENVEGFLTGGDGRFIFDLLDPVIEAGYRVHLHKVNAANFGVPQHRKRVIGIGGLGFDPSFPQPTHTAHGAPGAHLAARRLPPTPNLAAALEGLPPASTIAREDVLDHIYRELTGDDLERAVRLKPGQRMRDLPEEFWHESYKRRAFRRVMDGTPVECRGGAPAGVRRLRLNEPSKAITGAAINEFVHPLENRTLTLRECARVQTFPDSFRFIGARRDQAQLIGNAVPPRFVESIATHLRGDIKVAKIGALPGKLLSFVPTLSAGMSPILEKVCNRVDRAYGNHAEQGILWP
jgi:DNA (cytosine-5)-methyltransferase 1